MCLIDYSVERQLQIDNHTLVEECKNGDKEALNLFYLRFAPRMLSVIRRYVSDEKDAEDILHDGFIVAFTRLGSLRDADRVEYWLATIMKNLSLQFLQSQDVAQMLHDIPEMEDTPQIDDIIDLKTLETLIKKLPAGYQKVFRLAVLENKSHKEIAKLLGIAPNSSSSQLFHAKLMMRKLITDYKKQTGVWCLLLLCGGAGIMLWRHLDRVQPLPEIMIAHHQESHSSSLARENSVDSLLPSSKTKASLSPLATASGSNVAKTIPSQQGIASVMLTGPTHTTNLTNTDSETSPSENGEGNTKDSNIGSSDNPTSEATNNNVARGVDQNVIASEQESALAENTAEMGSALADNNGEGNNHESDLKANVSVAEVADSIGSDDKPRLEEMPKGRENEVYYTYMEDTYLDDAEFLQRRISKKSQFSDWSLRVSADAGLLAFNGDSSDDAYGMEGPGWAQNPGVGNDKDPENPNNPNNPDNTGSSGDSNNSDNTGEKRVLRRNAPGYKNYNDVAHTNYLPVSFSVAVNKALDNTFSVETGLTYTYLHTTFESLPSYSNCHWHYLGIPLKLNAKLCNFSRVSMYMSAGGIMDIPLYSNAVVRTTSGTPDLWGGRFTSPVVWSLSASFGISIKLTKKIDVFLEPTLQYHFEHSVKVPNVWSDEKWGFSLPIGFRFNL